MTTLAAMTITVLLVLVFLFSMVSHSDMNVNSFLSDEKTNNILLLDAVSYSSETEKSSGVSVSDKQKKQKRLAVIVAGSFLRFSLSSFLEHVAVPVTKQGYSLDYFVCLSINNAPAYRADLGYMNYVTWDPLFDNYTASTTAERSRPSAKYIQSTLQRHFSKIPNASLRHLDIQTSMVDLDLIPEVVQQRNKAKRDYPKDKDLDLRFPMLDLRPQAIIRTANANRNMLRLFWNQQQLWKQMLAQEKKDGRPYQLVMFMRDDTEWFAPLDLDQLLQQQPQQQQQGKRSTGSVFIPSCDARKPPMHPLEINDHIAIATRNAASVYGEYFSILFRPNITLHCNQQLHESSASQFRHRGCNSEMILKFALRQQQQLQQQQQDPFQIQFVGQGLIPMQRVAHVKTKRGVVLTCFHKYCQSVDRPFNDYGLQKCNSLENLA